MAIDMLPWLKVIADEDRIEPDFLGKTGEAQQRARIAPLGIGQPQRAFHELGVARVIYHLSVNSAST